MTTKATRGSTQGTVFKVVLSLFMLVVTLPLMEGVLRLKNSSMQNYDIEMWRYAKELKFLSGNPVLGHEHRRSESALLQSIEIRTNELGMRGGPIEALKPGGRRVLVLGASITLGWGVKEEETMTARLEQMFEAAGQDVQVLNAGIGNYNTERYVELFFQHLKVLKPTDIVVHYFLRDAEVLTAGGGNVLLRNSQLAVTLWTAKNRLFRPAGEQTLIDHYKAVYEPSAPGYRAMIASLDKLVAYCREHGIQLYLAMVPDVHNLTDYPFGFIHERMKGLASEREVTFVDLLPAFEGLSPEKIWAMPGDPHPNALGHKLMADALFPVLKR
jgi:lysophospholipase L1-like esterase